MHELFDRMGRAALIGLAGGALLAPHASAESAVRAPGTEAAPLVDADIAFANRLSRAFQGAARRIEPSVVHITSVSVQQRSVRDIFGRVRRTDEVERPAGLGSGVIIDDAGHIITNNHVVDGADRLTVRLMDGREYPAELVGGDPGSDIAVLRIDAGGAGGGLVSAGWGDSEALGVGEWVIAVGSPFGFEQTVTAGIVSAKGRPALDAGETGFLANRYQEFIQTDAAINPGNSGGPLVDLAGRVVGINTAIATRSGGSNGLGFAIPSDLARAVAGRLIDTGRVDRGYLGVTWDGVNPKIDPDLSRRLGIRGGVEIASVLEGGPADEAGLREGDIIVAFNGRTTENANRLRNAISITAPGEPAAVEFVRDEQMLRAEVIVMDRLLAEAEVLGATPLPALGALAEQTRVQRLRRGEVLGETNGVRIVSIIPGGPADRAGMEPGDVVLEIDGNDIDDIDEAARRLDDDRLDRGTTLLIFRPSARGGGMTGEIDVRSER
ncbi:MAG: trypsin-like peptidase domain-containing protein [Planctomycetota bacterium]